jgi:hypothetical protein
MGEVFRFGTAMSVFFFDARHRVEAGRPLIKG